MNENNPFASDIEWGNAQIDSSEESWSPSLSSAFDERRLSLFTDRDKNNEIKIKFRPIEPKDRAKIQALHEEWFPVEYHEEFYDNLVLHQMPKTGQKLYTCVATDANDPNDEIVAACVAARVNIDKLNSNSRKLLINDPLRHTRGVYIMTLGTIERYRGAGLATALVEKCIDDLISRDEQCGALYLHVIISNVSAISFYEKLGFWRVKQIKDYYTIGEEKHDCFLYSKYFHGNRGHLNVFNIMSRWLSSIWTQVVTEPIHYILGDGNHHQNSNHRHPRSM